MMNLEEFDQSNLDLLPPEILTGVLPNLSPADLFHFCSTSSRSNQYCLDEKFWRDKLRHDYPQKRSNKPKDMSWKQYYKYIFLGTYRSPISAGIHHYGIIDKNGNLWMGGDNSEGQRGEENLDPNNKLNKLSFESPVIQVDCNEYSTGVVTKDGKAYVFGRISRLLFKTQGIVELRHQFGSNKSIKFVTVTNHSYGVIFDDGSIYLQHRDEILELAQMNVKYVNILATYRSAQIGIVNENDQLTIYHRDPTRDIPIIELCDISIVKIGGQSPDKLTYIVLTNSGDVYTWGYNRPGHLGQGHFDDIDTPTKINLPKIKSIDFNGYQAVAITEDGRVFMWGLITDKVIPHAEWRRSLDPGIKSKYIGVRRTTIPIEIEILSRTESGDKIIDISIGREFGLALTKTGKIKRWGRIKYSKS